MMYKKIGTIDNISEIPFNKKLIVTGKVDKIGWMWQMGGMFIKIGNEIIFRNEYDMTTKVEDGEIGLNILEKIFYSESNIEE